MSSSSSSLLGWWYLNREDQVVVGAAVDRGERVEDPRLRPVAVALASGLLKYNGWRILRRPGYLLLLSVLFAVVVVSGHWWLLFADVALGVICYWIVERQARNLRPQWRRAVRANEDI